MKSKGEVWRAIRHLVEVSGGEVRFGFLLGLWVFVAATPAFAGAIVGGSSLIGGSDVNQLESWLGQGELTLSRIYAKSAGDTSADFHAAANGQGATFTLIEIINNGVSRIVGGYNPLSWNSSGTYNFSNAAADQTAFLFNLTDALLYEQFGPRQTYNHAGYGPTFGGGHDLHINSALAGGYANIGHTYGDNSQFGQAAYRNAFTGSYNSWSVGGLEVFTLSAALITVPEPVSWLVFALGLLALSGFALPHARALARLRR